MTTITLEVPDELAQAIHPVKDRLPEILALGMERLPPAPASVYRYILAFLANAPTAQEIANFRPTSAMEERLRTLLQRERIGELSDVEIQELDEYEQIEHFIIMLKSGHLPQVVSLS
ncbi:MAG: hypothetical protein U0350_11750 [Caldilineaceae bacterium]